VKELGWALMALGVTGKIRKFWMREASIKALGLDVAEKIEIV
jgi:hypothetical protein